MLRMWKRSCETPLCRLIRYLEALRRWIMYIILIHTYRRGHADGSKRIVFGAMQWLTRLNACTLCKSRIYGPPRYTLFWTHSIVLCGIVEYRFEDTVILPPIDPWDSSIPRLKPVLPR